MTMMTIEEGLERVERWRADLLRARAVLAELQTEGKAHTKTLSHEVKKAKAMAVKASKYKVTSAVWSACHDILGSFIPSSLMERLPGLTAKQVVDGVGYLVKVGKLERVKPGVFSVRKVKGTDAEDTLAGIRAEVAAKQKKGTTAAPEEKLYPHQTGGLISGWQG